MTLMKVRGKRGAPKEVKWNYGKQRKLRPGSTTASSRSSSTCSTPSTESISRRRGKKRVVELSRLEELPTEVLQAIFEYSANLELPLASPRLASQLASRHLYHSLTSIILEPVLDKNIYFEADIHAAMRLMNSKFFTWPFLQSWLQEEYEALRSLSEWQTAFGPRYGIEVGPVSVEQQEEWTWQTLRPSPRLAPPVKLLRGPFTQDNIRLLKFLIRKFRVNPEEIDPMFTERAKEGLQQAVLEGANDVLSAFWIFGMQPDTELLRLAVIDSGCDKELVRSLVNRVYNMTSGPVDMNFLDPALWSWAEKAHANGNEKGPWLKDLLKDAARESSRKEQN